MKTAQILDLVVKYLPALISIAEGLFGWKRKSGQEKKNFVEAALKTAVEGIAAESTGGQKETWDKIKEPVSAMIDGAVAIANASGWFDENAKISGGF